MPYQGSRHSIDLHTHDTVLMWWEERREKPTLKRSTNKKVAKTRMFLAEKAKNWKVKKAWTRKKTKLSA